MKKNNTKIAKRLSQYSSFALAMAGVSEADGQVVYTDVDPDFSGTVGTSFNIDFNNDGVIELYLENYSSNGNTLLYAYPENSNGLLGSIFPTYPSVAFPYALDSGNNISSGATGDFTDSYYFNILNINTPNANIGNWIGVSDKFLGVRFEIGNNIHYGWVRLDVTTNGDYTVKDFAYEAIPGVGIQAGEGLSIESRDFEGFSFHPNPVKDKLTLKAQQNIQKVCIYDLSGKEILSEKAGKSTQHLEVSQLETGIYFMEVFIDGNSKVFRVVKE
jgi:hypothetical protein